MTQIDDVSGRSDARFVGSVTRGLVDLGRRVRRGLTWRLRLKLAQAAPPQRRQDLALAALEQVQQRESSLPAPKKHRTLLAKERVIRRPDMPESLRNMVPAPLRDWDDADPQLRRIRTRVSADLVVLAKFDIGASVKLRAAYRDLGLIVAIQPIRPSGSCGVSRAVWAHQVVAQHVPGLVPPLIGHGELDGDLRYLVEGWLDGRPLMSSARLARALPQLLQNLATVQAGHGYGITRPTERWGEEFAERWQATRDSGIVPGDLGEAVDDLLTRDLTMRTSWVHGDLVASNVMRTADGIVLIDLEHSMVAPVMHDAGKLHLFAARPAETLDLLLNTLGGDTPEGGYSSREELALVHAHMLSRYPRRSKSLEGHPRAGVYEEQAQRHAQRLAEVLDVG